MAELGPSPLASGDELPVADARAAMLRALQPVAGLEQLPLAQALGRVLAADVVSPIAVPAHDNSAMDGYALHGADLLAGARHVAVGMLSPIPGTGALLARQLDPQRLRVSVLGSRRNRWTNGHAILAACRDLIDAAESCIVLQMYLLARNGVTFKANAAAQKAPEPTAEEK